MNYLEKMKAGGDLLKQLEIHAKEYDGPCGQSSNVIEGNRIKKQSLLDARNKIIALTHVLNVALDMCFDLGASVSDENADDQPTMVAREIIGVIG